MKSLEFEAIPSGDHECFCFDVDKETYENIIGKEEVQELEEISRECGWDCMNRSNFNEGMYRVYIDDILTGFLEGKIRVKIEIEQIN